MANPNFDFRHLTAEERVQLAEDLWDSLSELPEPTSLTGAQAEELDRRVEEYRRDGDPGTPWVEALDEIERSRS
ncbi:MAG: addiction module protein [Acidobacteriota bacterium]